MQLKKWFSFLLLLGNFHKTLWLWHSKTGHISVQFRDGAQIATNSSVVPVRSDGKLLTYALCKSQLQRTLNISQTNPLKWNKTFPCCTEGQGLVKWLHIKDITLALHKKRLSHWGAPHVTWKPGGSENFFVYYLLSVLSISSLIHF